MRHRARSSYRVGEMLPAGPEKGIEEPLSLGVVAGQVLWMPLHADGVRVPRHLDCLDDAIRSLCGNHETWGQILDGLVVPAVDLQGISAQDLRQLVTLYHRNRMSKMVGWGAGCTRVLECAGHLGLDILIQAASKRDVQYLDTAADREERLAVFYGPASERKFHTVSLSVDGPALLMDRFAIVNWIDIPASRQQEPVQSGIDRAQRWAIRQLG